MCQESIIWNQKLRWEGTKLENIRNKENYVSKVDCQRACTLQFICVIIITVSNKTTVCTADYNILHRIIATPGGL